MLGAGGYEEFVSRNYFLSTEDVNWCACECWFAYANGLRVKMTLILFIL